MPCSGLREGHSAVKLLKWIVLSASFMPRPHTKCIPESPREVPTESWPQGSASGFRILKLAASFGELRPGTTLAFHHCLLRPTKGQGCSCFSGQSPFHCFKCMSGVKETQEVKMTLQKRFPMQPLTGFLWGKSLLSNHLPGNIF